MKRYRSPRERQLRRTRAALAALRAGGRARAGARALRRRRRRQRARLAPGSERARGHGPRGASCSRSPTRPSARPSSTSRTAPWRTSRERLPLEVPLPCAGARRQRARRGRARRRDLPPAARHVHRGRAADRCAAPRAARAARARRGRGPCVARALEDFEHPAADRAMQWDPRHVGAVVEALAPHVEDPRGASSSHARRRGRGRGDRAARAAPAAPGRALRRDRLERDRPARPRRAG